MAYFILVKQKKKENNLEKRVDVHLHEQTIHKYRNKEYPDFQIFRIISWHHLKKY